MNASSVSRRGRSASLAVLVAIGAAACGAGDARVDEADSAGQQGDGDDARSLSDDAQSELGAGDADRDAGGSDADGPMDAGGDVAVDSGCAVAATCACTADLECARFDGSDRCAAHHRCSAGHCLVDPSTAVVCDASGDTACRRSVCDSSTGACALSPRADGTTCDDGLYCTSNDRCRAGACAGDPRPCGPSCMACDEASRTCAVVPGSCYVAGVCVGAGAIRPTNACELCEPSAPSVWSAAPAGAACTSTDVCALSPSCDGARVCVGQPRAPTAAPSLSAPRDGVFTGSPWAPSSFATLRPLFAWLPTADLKCGPVRYQIQLDDSCGAPIGACSFPSPEIDQGGIATTSWRPTADLPISAVAPVGARYVWRVRACVSTACSAWSEPRYLSVGRVAHDVDGDGYSDLIVGSPDAESTKGRVDVFRGSPTGFVLARSIFVADPAHTQTFGQVVTVGDLDGDGFADVVAGDHHWSLPDYSDRDDRLLVFAGGPSGLGATPTVILGSPKAAPLDAAPFLPMATAVGDLDDDGLADLVVAAKQGGSAPAAAYVYTGQPGLVPTAPSFAVPGHAPTSWGDYDNVHGLATDGDVDGDGRIDLALLRANQTNTNDVLTLFAGVRGGPPMLKVTLKSSIYEVRTQRPMTFADDVTGDAFADVLVHGHMDYSGTPADEPLLVFPAKSTGIAAPPTFELAPPAKSVFGWAFATGDLNGDGQADLVVGAPGSSSSTAGYAPGRVYVYRGPISASQLPITLRTPNDFSRYGQSVEWLGDANGDGYGDFAASAPYGGQGGTVYFIPGSSAGPTTATTVAVDNPRYLFTSYFGECIAH
jgi:hypothetical protein